MQARVARPRRSVVYGGDETIGQGAQRGDREIRRRLADVEDLDLRALRDGRAVARVPAAFLKIGDDDDGARTARQRLDGRREGGAVPGGAKADCRAIDRRRGQHAILSGPGGDFGFVGERHDADAV